MSEMEEASAALEEAGRSISITLPRDWEQVPVDPTAYASWLEGQFNSAEVDERVSGQLMAAMRSVLIEGRAEGLVLAGAYLDMIEQDEADDEGAGLGDDPPYSMVAASVSVMVRPAGDVSGVLSPFAWEAALRESAADGTLKLVRMPEPARVGQYDAVKAVVLDELPADGKSPAVTQLAVDYYSSIDDGQTILIVGFRTPCTWLQEEFEPLFDVIAETLQIEDGASNPA